MRYEDKTDKNKKGDQYIVPYGWHCRGNATSETAMTKCGHKYARAKCMSFIVLSICVLAIVAGIVCIKLAIRGDL